VLPAAHGAEVSPAGTYLERNNDKFRQMLKAVSVDDKALAAMNGVLLAPSDAAVDSLAASMGMTTKELLGKPLLVDRITSYHFMPAIKVTKAEKIVNMPLITKTGVMQCCEGGHNLCGIQQVPRPAASTSVELYSSDKSQVPPLRADR